MTTTVTSLNGKYWSGLTLDEIKGNKEGKKQRALDRAILRFNKVDGNGDGSLSVDEIRAYDLKKKKQHTAIAVGVGTAVVAALGVALYAISKKNLQISENNIQISSLKDSLAKVNEKLDTPLGKVVSQESVEHAEVERMLNRIETEIRCHSYGVGPDQAGRTTDYKRLAELKKDASQALMEKYSTINKMAEDILDSPNPAVEKIRRKYFECGIHSIFQK